MIRHTYTLFFGLMLAMLSACAGKVPSEPFQTFSKALVELHQGTDQALANIDQMSEDRFLREALEQMAAANSDKIEELRITIEDNPLNWDVKPLFLKIEQFREGARQTTGALVGYSELLQRLSAPELLPVETFDTLTANLNANANDAITKISGTPPDPNQLALFSTLAAESARQYLEHKRRSDLIAVVTDNQPTVESFATQMQEGVKIAATIAGHEYDEKFQEIVRNMFTGASPASDAMRRTTLEQLIALDRKYISDLNTFNALHQAYGRIPGAHQNLGQALSNREIELNSIIALLEAGQRLEQNFDQAVIANKSKAAQAVADKARAQAQVLEADADAAQLRAASAEVEAINARAQADADPADAQKQAKADDLERRASELQELANVKKARADEAKVAAESAQRQANEIKTKLLSEGA